MSAQSTSSASTASNAVVIPPVPQPTAAETELTVVVNPEGKECSADADCAGNTCSTFACTVGHCKKAAVKTNFSKCAGPGEGAHRCYAELCFESYDCSSRCAQDVALEAAAALSTEFKKCKGPDLVTCRKSKMREDTPLFENTQRGIDQCMVGCGYPSLAIPPGIPPTVP